MKIPFYNPLEHRSALQELVAVKNRETLTRLLAEASDSTKKLINHRDDAGRSLLVNLIEAGWTECLPLALAAGADPKLSCQYGLNALHHAIAAADTTAVDLLLEGGMTLDLPVQNKNCLTPVQLALTLNNFPMVKHLVEKGADLAQENIHGMNAYYYFGYTDRPLAEYLLALPTAQLVYGACTLTAARTIYTPLRMALEFSNFESAAALLDYGVSVNERASDGAPLIHHVIEHIEDRDKLIVSLEFLRDRGADMDEKAATTAGNTPLMTAVRKGDKKAVMFLLDQGANPNQANHHGETPLHAAAAQRDVALLQMLIAGGAKLDTQQDNGNTPLHIAAFRNHRDVVHALLGAGANPTLRNNKNVTPDQVCQSENQINVHEAILRAQRLWRETKGKNSAPRRFPGMRRQGP